MQAFHIRVRLGHSSIKTTADKYLHVTKKLRTRQWECICGMLSNYFFVGVLWVIIKNVSYKHLKSPVNQWLTYAAFHLKLNQTIHFNSVFHWQFFCKWLDETHDDHFCCFFFRNTTAHQVEKLFF